MRFVAENRTQVAKFLKDASNQRLSDHAKAVAAGNRDATERKRFRQRSQREVAQSLGRHRDERLWAGKRLRRTLNNHTREIRWQVVRILNNSCADRARNERIRIRDASNTLRSIQRSVHCIRASVRNTTHRKLQSLRARKVFS
jgi:hypothetical protein